MDGSPYEKDWRLQDVIAAIQVMGTYKYDKLPIREWTYDKLPETPKSFVPDERVDLDKPIDPWEIVFSQHPEFFTFDDGRYSLTWRRARKRVFDLDQERALTTKEIAALPKEKRDKLAREPLDDVQIQALITTAISLHASVLAQKGDIRAENQALRDVVEEVRQQRLDARWWIPLFAVVATIVNAIIDGVFKLYSP